MVVVRLRVLSSAKRLYKTIWYQSSPTIASKSLIQYPISRIHTTIDSEMVEKSDIEKLDLSRDSLLSYMHSSDPHKPQLVLERRLDKLLNENEKNPKEMLEWYEAKMVSGFSADLDTYECIILRYLKLKRFEDAYTFYEKMLLLSPQIKPNMSILNSMLLGLCEHKDLDKIKRFLKSVLDHKLEINGSKGDKLVEFCSELGLVEELECMLEGKSDLDLDFEVVSQIYNGLIRVYARFERLDDLQYCIRRMLKNRVSFKSLELVGLVVLAYHCGGACDKIHSFLDIIRRSPYELVVGYHRYELYNKILMALDDFGRI